MPRGKISQRSGGKLVDTWTYEYQGVEEPLADDADVDAVRHLHAKGIKVPIKLILHKKFKESERPPLETKEVWFSVECDKPKFSVSGPDIEALRASMWEHLDKHFAVRWERYFKVNIGHAYTAVGLTFEYRDVEKGTAWDGSLLLREYEFSRGRIIRPWPGEFRDGQGKVMACIPATPENEAALKEFADRIHELRKRLADFLRPDQIMQTLANLSAVALLPQLTTDHHQSKEGSGEEDR